MNRQANKNVENKQQRDMSPTEPGGYVEEPKRMLSTVTSFTAVSGEFVIWFMLGTELRDGKLLQQMAAKEAVAWDKDFAEFLSHADISGSLLNIYKLIEQIDQAFHRSGKALVVIDNYELIENGLKKELIGDMIGACGPAITFILISGRDVTVGARVQSKLLRPNGPLYQLTKAEIKTYYTALGIIPSDEMLDYILQITQGEAVIISMLGECLKRGKTLDRADVKSAVSNLSELFFNEYYQPYPEKLRQFQILLSLLDDFNLELLRGLTSLDFEDMQQLFQNHAFIQCNLEDGTYHIQGLYRDFLRDRSLELPKKLRHSFLRKAAQWHESKGDYLRAIKYSALCGEFAKIPDLFKKCPPQLLDRDTSHFLLSMLEQVSDVNAGSLAELELIRCLLLAHVSQDALALHSLTALREKLERKDRTSDEDAVLGDVYLTFAFREWGKGSPEFLLYISKAAEHLQGESELFGRRELFVAGSALRFKDMQAGDLMVMKDAFLQSIPFARKVIPAKCGTIYLALAEAHFCRMEVKEAVLYAGKAIEESNAFQQWSTLCETYYMLQRMSMVDGDLDEITSFLNHIHDSCRVQNGNDNIGSLSIDRVSQAHFYLYMGFYHMVEPWVKEEYLNHSTYAQKSGIGRELFIHAWYLFQTQRQYYPAIFFIDQSIPICYGGGLWNCSLKMIILKAIIYSTLGINTMAARFLKEAYQLSKPNDIIFFFVEFGELMVELLEDTKTSTSEMDPFWIKNIQEKAMQYEKTKKLVRETYLRRHPEYSVKKLDKLTGKEFLALKYLCNGLSNEEIAEQMNILGTSVYRLLSMAYKKIGATGHNDAVRIAVLEGILDIGSE